MKTMQSTGEAQTMAIAADLARQAQPGDIFTLTGDLGAGKSVFARGFIRALCGDNTDVPSPTFTLVQAYDSPKGTIYHFDLYRLEDPEEVLALNWDEALAEGICLIEWPDKSGTLLKGNIQPIEIKSKTENNREIKIGDIINEK